MRIVFLVFISIIFSFKASAQYEVIVSTDYPPYNYVNDKGELVGFNIDILNAIKELYTIDIKVIGKDWKTANIFLENGLTQAIGGAHYSGTPDTKYIYTRSVIQTSHCFLYNHKNIKKVSAKTIRTTQEPLIVLWNNDVLIHYILSINPNAKFVFAKNYRELLDALERKDVTCAFSQKIASMYFANQLGYYNIRVGDEEVLERNMGFKIANESPRLAEILNNGLEVILSNGEYQIIYDKWIKKHDTQNFSWRDYSKYFIVFGILIFTIIILLVIFNHILQTRVRNKTKGLQLQLQLNTIITDELKRQKLKAEESDKMKSSFLANMSHEIRTPMNGILGFTELLKSHDYSKDEQNKFIEIIRQSGVRMLSTINNIIEISKIESGVETVQLNKVNIEKLIQELYHFFIPEAKRKGIKLIIEKEETDSDLTFYTDEYKLNSILTNLIKNALKFTKKGSIKIGYSITSEVANFYVVDTGIGIKKEKQNAIFNNFVQADASHSSGFEGSGLGLSISSEYTKMLYGKIWVESEFNLGSTFFVNIPNQFQSPKPEQNKTEIATNNKTVIPRDYKIIIAEDDISSVFLLKYILNEITDNILHAADGLEVIELIKNNPDTDLILMDSKMPKLNGMEAVKQIREFNDKVYIIAQTAFAQDGYREKTIAAGCNDYIEKPINKTKLLEMIRKRSAAN